MLARATDPDTSHLAASKVQTDGTLERMQDIAAKAVRDNPGLTSNELEAATGWTDGKLRKRLNEIVQDGRIREGEKRHSTISGRLCKTYYPTIA